MTPEEKQRREADDKTRRTKGVVGTKAEREQFRADKRRVARQDALDRMTPQQREQALAREAAAKQAQEAKVKKEADDKTRRTKGVVGTKAEREQFRADKRRVARQDALDRMTPQQREQALAREAAAKQAQEAKAKKEADDKTRRTKGVVGTKAEREQFRADKRRVARQDALDRMTPQQREQALAREAAVKQAQEAKAKKEADDKTRRTVAKVGTKEEREQYREDKKRVARQDALDRMTPEQRARALERERRAQEAEAAKQAAQAEAKARRTVAVVGDEAERRKFREGKEAQAAPQAAVREAGGDAQPETPARAPVSAAPVVVSAGFSMSRTVTAQAWSEVSSTLAMLA